VKGTARRWLQRPICSWYTSASVAAKIVDI
jgi:hypothetical protein